MHDQLLSPYRQALYLALQNKRIYTSIEFLLLQQAPPLQQKVPDLQHQLPQSIGYPEAQHLSLMHSGLDLGQHLLAGFPGEQHIWSPKHL